MGRIDEGGIKTAEGEEVARNSLIFRELGLEWRIAAKAAESLDADNIKATPDHTFRSDLNVATEKPTTPARTRKSISKSLRFRIFHRDGFICQYCGQRPPDVVLELDHIHPHSKGGDNSEMNLVTSCDECNRGKSDKVLTERAIRLDADLAYFEVQQEIAEAKRFLLAQSQREEMRADLVRALQGIWEVVIPDSKCPSANTFEQMLESYSVTEIAESMRITGRRNASRRIGWQQEIISYIYGVLRSREREGY